MRIAMIACTFIWAGMILGISFLEAPLKFRAPHITTELGLGIGKVVFTALNRVEIVLTLILVAGLIITKPPPKMYWLFALPMGILLIQSLWLLPVLTQRIDKILAGQSLPGSYHHLVFIVLEVSKVIGLIVAGVHLVKCSK